MKAKFFSFLIVVAILSFSVPAIAFYPDGRINSDISYSNVELIPRSYSIRVTGTLKNHTSQPIRFNGTVMFVTIHKEVLNSGRIYETIPANGIVQFNTRLDKNNFKRIQHCYKLAWEVKDYSNDRNRSKSSRKKPDKKSIGYSNTRAYDSYVSISGKGNHNSDQFKLKTGLYIAKVSHTGQHHCGIKLLHGDGNLAELLANEIGYIVQSKAVRIDEDGYYLLNVSADGDWTVNMEYQEPKTIEQEDTTDQNQTIQTTVSSGSNNPVIIKLKNGRTMKADSYWEAGDKLKVSIYGGIMTVKKSDVQEIIAPTKDAQSVVSQPDQPVKSKATAPKAEQEIRQKLEEHQSLSRDLEKARQKEAELDRAIEAEQEERRKFHEHTEKILRELQRKIDEAQ